MVLTLMAGMLAVQLTNLTLHLHEAGGAAAVPMPGLFGMHLGLTLLAVLAVSLLAVRSITRPLQLLASAATRFAHDLDAAPLDESGPQEVAQAARAFNFMQARLRQLVSERSLALAAVSHDLRTPLTRMRLRAELVDDQQVQRKLNEDIDTMQAMVDGVLAYLRGQQDREAPQAIDMTALLESVVDDQAALGRTVRLAPGNSTDRPVVYSGRLTLLRRALTNLVENAAAHAGDVSVRLVDGPDWLRLVVEDNGPGIPPPELERVKQPFVRLDTARAAHAGGMGMGLAIAQDAAALHGGRLRLENRTEGGLRAMLELPHDSNTEGKMP
jgi:signal transduction histidine kinase